MRNFKKLFFAVFLLSLFSCAAPQENRYNEYDVETYDYDWCQNRRVDFIEYDSRYRILFIVFDNGSKLRIHQYKYTGEIGDIYVDDFNFDPYQGKIIKNISYGDSDGTSGDILYINFTDGTSIEYYAYKYNMKIYELIDKTYKTRF